MSERGRNGERERERGGDTKGRNRVERKGRRRSQRRFGSERDLLEAGQAVQTDRQTHKSPTCRVAPPQAGVEVQGRRGSEPPSK